MGQWIILITWETSFLMFVPGRSLGRSLSLWANDEEEEEESGKGLVLVENNFPEKLHLFLIRFLRAAINGTLCFTSQMLCFSLSKFYFRMKDGSAIYKGEETQ